MTDWATHHLHGLWSDDNANTSTKLFHMESLARMKEEGDVEMNIWKNDAFELLRMGEW